MVTMMIARRALCSLASKQNPSLSSSVRFPALLSSTSPHNPSLSSFVRYLCTGKHIIDVHPRLINCGVWIVPENKAFVIERFKKYHKTLYPGLHFMIPLVDRIAYVHSLKKEALQVSNVSSVTATRLPITMNCVLYVKVVDPKLASYSTDNPIFSLTDAIIAASRRQVAQNTFDLPFNKIEALNNRILKDMCVVTKHWGMECIRYEIKDVCPRHAQMTLEQSHEDLQHEDEAIVAKARDKFTCEVQAFFAEVRAEAGEFICEVKAIFSEIRAEANKLPGEVKALFAEVSDEIRTEANKLPGEVKALFTKVSDEIRTEANKLPGEVKALFTEVSDEIRTEANKLPGEVKALFTEVSDEARIEAGELIREVKAFFVDVREEANKLFCDVNTLFAKARAKDNELTRDDEVEDIYPSSRHVAASKKLKRRKLVKSKGKSI